MFNIRSLVNRIAQTRDGEGADSSGNKTRSTSQSSNHGEEEIADVQTEGFLCPTCMTAFPSPEDLQLHYETVHLEPGANYLCPVCKARLGSSSELEQHFAVNHSASSENPKYATIQGLRQELSHINSSLNEERWHSEELKKEVDRLQKLIRTKGTSEEGEMYQHQLQGLEATKGLLTSEVVLLRKQLAAALESTVSLRQERDKLEEKTARYSQTVAELQATLDENLGQKAGLQETIRDLEAQLTRRASVDDAEILKRELASVQRMMDELNREKERERDDLEKNLNDLQVQHESLKNELNLMKENYEIARLNVTTLEEERSLANRQLEQVERNRKKIDDELTKERKDTDHLRRSLSETNEQLSTLQRIREETDVCVSRLREEVTSLQEMLSQTRHEAKGEVSAKEDQLLQLQMQLINRDQKISHLESRYQTLENTQEELKRNLTVQQNRTDEEMTAKKQREETIEKLEDKLNRMEQEKTELMTKIEAGEGINTAIKQLQEENVRLQSEVQSSQIRWREIDEQFRMKEKEWSQQVLELQEERTALKNTNEKFAKDLEELQQTRRKLEADFNQLKNEKDAVLYKKELLTTQVSELGQTIQQKNRLLEEKEDQIKKLSGQIKVMNEDGVKWLEEKDKLMKENGDRTLELQVVSKVREELRNTVAEKEKECHELQTSLHRLQEESKNQHDESRLLTTSLEQQIHKLNQEMQSLEENHSCLQRQLEQEQLDMATKVKELGDKEAIIKEQQERLQKMEEVSTLLSEKENVIAQQEIQLKQLEILKKAATEQEEIISELRGKLLELEALKVKFTEMSEINSQLLERIEQLQPLQKQVEEKETSILQLHARVKELEPLVAALEKEKEHRKKETEDWLEKEQLLLGEKESLSTLKTHLQQQLDELREEHRIYLQRVKNEADMWQKERTQLTEQLSIEKESRSKEKQTLNDLKGKLENEIKTLTSNLNSTREELALKCKRCDELQIHVDQYHSQKIELETRISILEEEKNDIQSQNNQLDNELERSKMNSVELRRRLEDSQAALHELGRENQSLQMENAKLQGRKWADDSEAYECHSCQKDFTLTVRKHHCRNCGQIFCSECSSKSTAVGTSRKPVRVCDSCFKELTSSH